MFRSDTLFSRFMNVACDILFTGLLWLLCCIPVVTIGASSTAAYYTISKVVRHRTGYVRKEFFRSFKANFKQSTQMGLVFTLCAAVIAVDIWYLWTNDNKLNSALFMIMLLISFIVMSLITYYFPLLSRFDKPNLEMMKLAGVVAFHYLPITIGIIVVFLIAVIGVYLMPWAILVIPGIYLYFLSYPMEHILKKLMPPVEEDSEEAQMWYYQ